MPNFWLLFNLILHRTFDYSNLFNPPKPKKDENHPDFKPTPCFQYGDADVLVEGLDQAKVLTNTVEVEQDLPKQILKLKQANPVSDSIHKIVQKWVFDLLFYCTTSCTIENVKVLFYYTAWYSHQQTLGCESMITTSVLGLSK